MSSIAVTVLLLAAVVAGQTISPSNASLPQQAAGQLLTIQGDENGSFMGGSFPVYPLKAQVGYGETTTAINAISLQGNLEVTTLNTTLDGSTIAYISCDPNADTSNISPDEIFDQVVLSSPSPKAILLYSLTAGHCGFSGDFRFGSVFTMLTTSASSQLLSQATDANATVTIGATSSTSSSASNNNDDGSPAPTTAVAMSILYSITGIITLLFLIIIATGAVRAHRHPERYGPRGGFPGRPRQSRAKGLARAMLETLPIVKFGDPEPAKPGQTEIELENGTRETPEAPAAGTVVSNGQREANTEANAEITPHPAAETTQQSNTEAGIGPDTHAEIEHSKDESSGTKDEDTLGCSICTEDFQKGEDVRVLPCNHKYHPACIDPWLLNVSGTCPLCRVDLRPETSHTTEFGDPSQENQNSGDPPPLAQTEGAVEATGAGNHSRNRVSRYLDLHRIRHASPTERIAALRRMRVEQQARENTDGAGQTTEITSANGEEERSRRRLTTRLRDTFRISTRTQPSARNQENAAAPASANTGNETESAAVGENTSS